MKRLIIILTLFLIFINILPSDAASKIVKKDIKVVAKDGFALTAILEYPNVKGKSEYSTVVLLHSLGYSSEWWGDLPKKLLAQGYAVVLIDFRGHGNSVYNAKLNRVSWTSLKKSAFVKYPDDVITVLDYIKNENKREFFKNWAIVGSDLGASTAICTTSKISYKPDTLVLLSPEINSKGVYVPVKLAEITNTDILTITGTNDSTGLNNYEYLSKFAQGTFESYIPSSRSTGMLMLKNDNTLSDTITQWIGQYLKG